MRPPSRRPRAWSGARPVRWASRSRGSTQFVAKHRVASLAAALHPQVGAPTGALAPRGGCMRHGKKYRSSAEAIAGKPRDTLALRDAVNMVKSSAKAKFDETVEIASHLGVDPRHS